MSFTTEIEHFFKILQQPPRWPFLGDKFLMEISIVNREDLIIEGFEVPFKIELVYENGDKVLDQSIFTCEREFSSSGGSVTARGKTSSQKSIMEIPSSGALKIWVGINELSAAPRHHGQTGFFLRFSSLNDRFAIFPVVSTQLTCVRYALSISVQPPREFFKDEGGRDKSITMNAELVDRRGNLVSGKEITLKAVLLYENDGPEVQKQSILRYLSDFPKSIDKSGHATLRFRIEEVSKNHQAQAFCIRIEPDYEQTPENREIAAVLTTPITVLSKRNKRKQQRTHSDGSTNNSVNSIDIHLRSASPPSTSGTFAMKQLQLQPSPQQLQLGHFPSASPQFPSASPQFASASSQFPLVKKQQLSLPQQPQHHIHQQSHIQQQQQQQQQQQPQQQQQTQPSQTQPSKSHKALEEVITWCQYVHKGLQDLEWQQVGYEPLNQMTNPIFRCPACWVYKGARPTRHQPMCMIAQALQVYQHKLLGQFQELDALLKVNTDTSSDSEGPESPPSIRDFGGPSFYRQPNLDLPFHHPALSSSCSVADMPPGNPIFGNPFLNSSCDGLSLGGLSSISHFVDTDAFGLSDEEDQVHIILVVLSNLGGFPAFDVGGKFVGVYQLQTVTNQLEFLSKRSLRDKDDQITESELLLLTHQRNRSSFVISKTDCVNLERTKEQASLMYFQHKNGAH